MHLFIGGFYDGERRPVEPHRHGDVIRRYRLPSLRSVDRPGERSHLEPVEVPCDLYRCMDWCVDGHRTQIYVAVELKPERVLEKLLEGYAGTGPT